MVLSPPIECPFLFFFSPCCIQSEKAASAANPLKDNRKILSLPHFFFLFSPLFPIYYSLGEILKLHNNCILRTVDLENPIDVKRKK